MALLHLPGSAALCLSVLVAVTYSLHLRRNCSRLPLPPGPKKLPLLGNLLDVPSVLPWQKYTEWSKEYDSDIIHLNVAGTSMIPYSALRALRAHITTVLSSFEATETLLEKRSALYSDRQVPYLPMVTELMGWYFNIVFMRYGDEWRTNRRLIKQFFNPKSSKQYRPHAITAARRLLERLLEAPDDFPSHLRQMAGELIMSVTYGIDVRSSDDPYIRLAEEAVHTTVVAAVPGAYLVNTFPILKHVPRWFPGAGFKRQAEEWSRLPHALMEVPFAATEREMDSGTARPSYTYSALQALRNSDKAYYKERHVKATAGTMFLAGADSLVSALSTFLLAMLANPHAQKQAQAEIDRITSGKHLPDLEDEESMPYVSALVKEVLRWKNVTPLGVPHLLVADDVYHGYHLPAGSMILANTWALLHDETIYPDPHSFNPERFLLDGKPNYAIRDPEVAFGYGRRLCPGRHMARSSLWIAVASILATFNITKAVDDSGNVVEPTFEYDSALLSSPLPFRCSITPRSKEAVTLVRGLAREEQM
ncbi:cytochrome P450 [Mycena capillaripes]|nr:cytochrome P450 [Mycena capillaripes]